jgi:hypothetical protein
MPPNDKAAVDKLAIQQALANETGTMIRGRLSNLRPPIVLENHIQLNDHLEVGPTVLDGISFQAVDSKALSNEINRVLDFTNQKAFSDPGEVQRDHLPLKVSMLATDGVGFREVGRAFLAEPIKVDSHQPWQAPKMDLGFGSQFGTTTIKLDISSLHWAVSSGICNVHVDRSGFTMQIGDELAVGPDAIQHIIDELLLKDKLLHALPKSWGPMIRRVTLIYPSTANGFSKWGPRIDATPILKKIAELPGVGGVMGRAHLPGVSVDVWRGKQYKVSLTATCGVSGGGCSATADVSGVF